MYFFKCFSSSRDFTSRARTRFISHATETTQTPTPRTPKFLPIVQGCHNMNNTLIIANIVLFFEIVAVRSLSLIPILFLIVFRLFVRCCCTPPILGKIGGNTSRIVTRPCGQPLATPRFTWAAGDRTELWESAARLD
jgi:hypothetical protein